MKKLIFSLALISSFKFVSLSDAQRYDPRIDVAQQAHDYRLEPAFRDVRDGRGFGRVREEAEQLRREVRRVREKIQLAGGGRGVRARFGRVVRSTEGIQSEVRRGGNPLRIRRQIEQTRAELYRVERELHLRSRGPRTW